MRNYRLSVLIIASATNGTHFAHNQIGINNYKMPLTFAPFQATSFKGPCVSCHMQSGNHKLDIAPGYAAGGICTKCHLGPYVMTAAKIEEEKEGYNAALSLLEAVLSSKGMTYTPNYPYVATKNWTAVGPANGSGKQNMGAAFNFNFLNEPGAFAHNRTYAKRIIYDSLEYLQKATVDGTINFSNFSSATVPVSKARTYCQKRGLLWVRVRNAGLNLMLIQAPLHKRWGFVVLGRLDGVTPSKNFVLT